MKKLIGWFKSRLEPANVRTSELGDILKSMKNGIQRQKEAENIKRYWDKNDSEKISLHRFGIPEKAELGRGIVR